MNIACSSADDLLAMNQIVHIALRKPYTFVVLSILIVAFGAMAVFDAPTDVFPVIQIPVSSVVWIYDGLMPQDGARTALRVLQDGDVSVRAHRVNLGQTYTNTFARVAKDRFKA